jgi:hypothetical protein
MDPSKLSPDMLMKMSQLVQELPPGMLSRMQTLMHNAMAGFDVQKDMEAFERELPAGFREKMARLMYEMNGVMPSGGPSAATPTAAAAKPEVVEIQKEIANPEEARLTVLRAVASGDLSPEQALSVLFPA